MNFFTYLSEKFSDAFQNETAFSFYIFISLTLLITLIFDLQRFKNNQVERQVSKRIGRGDTDEGFDITALFQKTLDKRKDRIELELEKANVLFNVKEYMTVMVLGGIFGFLIGFLIFPLEPIWKGFLSWLPFKFTQEFFGRALAGSVFLFIGTFLPKAYILYLVAQRKKLLNQQMQDSLLNIADALKSGYVINEAIKIVGKETAYPMGDEFTKAYREMETGKSFEASLNELKKRVDIPDFTMAINAMEIQYEVGGKLEPLLRNMVSVITERQELKKEIEKTIANSKMIGIILLCAPIFFIIIFTAMNKESLQSLLTNFIGYAMIGIGTICYVVAAWIIISIIKSVSKDV